MNKHRFHIQTEKAIGSTCPKTYLYGVLRFRTMDVSAHLGPLKINRITFCYVFDLVHASRMLHRDAFSVKINNCWMLPCVSEHPTNPGIVLPIYLLAGIWSSMAAQFRRLIWDFSTGYCRLCWIKSFWYAFYQELLTVS